MPSTPMRTVGVNEQLVYAQRVLIFLEGRTAQLDRIVASLDSWTIGPVSDSVLENHAIYSRDATHRAVLYSVDVPSMNAAAIVDRIRTASGEVAAPGLVQVAILTPDVAEIFESSLSETLRGAAILAWPLGAAAIAAAPLLRPKPFPWGFFAAGLGVVVLGGVAVYALRK